MDKCYHLSFSGAAFKEDTLPVSLTFNKNTHEYAALSVLYDGVISCEEAVNCVRDFDTELFENLTDRGLFNGEIYVRLLFDEGCYYYVGVCDKNKNVNAYLVDGEHGKIITTKKFTA